jgi:hypothetical protein
MPNKLLIVTETELLVEERIATHLKLALDFRVHKFSDIADEMLKLLGLAPDATVANGQTARVALVEWSDKYLVHHQRVCHAVYSRVRPLARIGRSIAIIGIRPVDVWAIAKRANADNVSVHILSIVDGQTQLSLDGVEQPVTAQLVFDEMQEFSVSHYSLPLSQVTDDATFNQALRAALTGLNLI